MDSHLSMNTFKVPWLHLEVASCVLKKVNAFLCIQCLLEHHCILTFVGFDYLLQHLNGFQGFCSPLSCLFGCMPHSFEF